MHAFTATAPADEGEAKYTPRAHARPSLNLDLKQGRARQLVALRVALTSVDAAHQAEAACLLARMLMRASE